MATVKIHEGTKVETPLEMQNDEGAIFVCPHKNLVWRNIPAGCLFFLHPGKKWKANLVVTNKRLITIPLPNKKKFAVESFYFKNIAKTRTINPQNQNEAATVAKFAINMKPGGNSSSLADGEFWVCYQVTAMNLLKAWQAGEADFNAQYGSMVNSGLAITAAYAKTAESRAHAEATGASHYTEYSPNFGKMAEAAKARAANMDFSKAGHAQIRDYIVDVINQYVEIANA